MHQTSTIMTPAFFFPLFICIAALPNLSSAKQTCIMPKGISDPSVFAALPPNSPAPDDSIFFAHILLGVPALTRLEAPVQFHTIQGLISTIFNTMGAFEDAALDVWGNQPPARFCKDAPDYTLYRSVTLAYITHFVFKNIVSSFASEYDALVTPWGINPTLCSEGAKQNVCGDVSTPWGTAFYRFKQYLDWVSRDGWNKDGSLSRKFNRIPYQDWSPKPYVPRNSPWKLTNKRRWQPLLEHNGQGFMFYQEHVTTHIGQFGRSYFVDDATYCSMTAPNPNYNYAKELDALLKRSAAMANDDVAKAKIEIFDNKATSLLVLQASFVFAQGFSGDSWEFITADMLGATALYESILLVWREKVRHDAIRPPTRLRSDRSGRRVTAFAGPYQGKKSMLADDWEPYIRTMPHAEYPSGSSCFCAAFSKAMALQFGSDKFVINGKQISLPLVLEAGKSVVEPGMPKSDVKLMYSRWSDVIKDCGQSRLDGGMHFTAAVGAGEALCEPMGEKMFNAIKALVNGQKPEFVQNYRKKLVKKMRCGKKSSRSG